MPNIIDQFTDVDFRRDPHYRLGDLTPPIVRAFGGRLKVFGLDRPSYEDLYATIPESEWPAEIAKLDAAGGGCDQLVCWIYNQRNEGSCVANACSQAHEIVQSLQVGKDRSTRLSAISLYKRIGRSPGSGAMVSDGLDEMLERGVLPLDNPENRARFGNAVMPPTGFYTAYPENWPETAKFFKVNESLVIRSVEGLMTALFNQHPVVVGRAGHSICYCRPMMRSGKLVVKYANSWGEWGDAGYGYDSTGMIRSSAGWAFAIRSVTIPTK
jgi:hypothetical protein